MAREIKQVAFSEETSAQIVDMRNQGSKWNEISNAMNMPVGKCMLIFSFATTPKKDRIKDATGEDIVRLRDEETLSWGVISARTGYPEGSCKSLYEKASGKPTLGNRIGKGGRHPGNAERPAKTEKPAKATAAKKAPAKKATATKAAAAAPSKLDGVDPAEIPEMLTGRAIKVNVGGGEPEVVRVKAVKKVAKGSIVLTDVAGQARTIKQSAVIGISKTKVA